MATALLALKYFRAENDSVAAGFLVSFDWRGRNAFRNSESLLFASKLSILLSDQSDPSSQSTPEFCMDPTANVRDKLWHELNVTSGSSKIHDAETQGILPIDYGIGDECLATLFYCFQHVFRNLACLLLNGFLFRLGHGRFLRIGRRDSLGRRRDVRTDRRSDRADDGVLVPGVAAETPERRPESRKRAVESVEQESAAEQRAGAPVGGVLSEAGWPDSS